jgi:6-pyruvoyltetrahydropterin/6-carboxytetrahydropterin synthase
MPELNLTAAEGWFAAARRIDGLAPGHPQGRLHGHNFQVGVRAELAPGWAPFAGAEVSSLAAHLQQCLEPLRHADLNTRIDRPTDRRIAEWIAASLRHGAPGSALGTACVGLRSTPQHGVFLDRQGAAHPWRRYAFEAAHRLPRVPPGHKCGRMHGHGFEVVLQGGAIDRPGADEFASFDLAWASCAPRLEHACLNDLAGLENPTSEILSSWLWQRLKPALPQLERVTVFETADCGASHDGRDFRIWKDFTLDSAVRLARAPAGDRRGVLHGHTYRLRLVLRAALDAVLGWTIDFGDVKEIFAPIFAALDHRPLHELPGLADADCASLAQWILRDARPSLPALVQVELYETPGCGALRGLDDVATLPF